jgi:CHAT domain-containing protein
LGITQTNSKSVIEKKIQHYQAKGDVLKADGDMEEALYFWGKANSLRNKIYPKNDYHRAWNYALLSNYHFELMEVIPTNLYADSCLKLLKNLTIAQQKEIKIYKIWNILGQSIKLNSKTVYNTEEIIRYQKVQAYYQKSIDFLLNLKTDSIQLAKTYHLMANSFTDLTAFNLGNATLESKQQQIESSKKANYYYNKALLIWNQLYGAKNHESAKTLYVNGLMYGYLNKINFPDKTLAEISYYSKAMKAFDITNFKKNRVKLKENTSKNNLLMCLVLNTIAHRDMYLKTKNETYLTKAKWINELSIAVWHSIIEQFKSKNTNKLLSVYTLNPFNKTIELEFLQKKMSKKSLEKVFEANQQLKFIDILKWNNKLNIKAKSLTKFQDELTKDELFIDIISLDEPQILFVTKNKIWIQALDKIEIQNQIKNFNQAISDINYNNFISSSYKLQKSLFQKKEYSSFKKLIISPSGIFAQLPFEALLYSNKNTKLNDYRKLDYLMNTHKISYSISTLFYSNQIEEIDKQMSAFAPYNKGYSQLPFSEKLNTYLTKEFSAKCYTQKNATLSNFVQSTESIKHLSAHGLIDLELSRNSGLVFSDSILRNEDIYNLNNKTKLMVINTCNSGLGKNYSGDGTDGFIRSFHSKGVVNTISNLWEVDDKASNEVIKLFYNNLFEGQITSEALQNAKLEMVHSAPNSDLAAPYYWAGHLAIGNELKVKQEKSNYLKLLIVLSCILVPILIVFIKKKLINPFD